MLQRQEMADEDWVRDTYLVGLNQIDFVDFVEFAQVRVQCQFPHTVHFLAGALISPVTFSQARIKDPDYPVHSCAYLANPDRPFPFAAHAVALTHLGCTFTTMYWLYYQYTLHQEMKEAEETGILREVKRLVRSYSATIEHTDRYLCTGAGYDAVDQAVSGGEAARARCA